MRQSPYLVLIGLVFLSGTAAPGPDRVPIESNALLPPVRIEAGGEIIDVGSCIGHAGPRLEDLDGDGLQDLLVGDFKGHIHVHRNTGTNSAPVYASGQLMEANGEVVKLPNW